MTWMTREEAKVIATWRLRFEATLADVAGMAVAVWGGRRVQEMTGFSGSPSSAQQGVVLLLRMERALGIGRGESVKMVLEQQICMECGDVQWAICYQADTPRECARCGKMAAVFAPAEEDEEG